MASDGARVRIHAGGFRQRISVLLLVLGGSTLTGCYTYVPVDFGGVESGHTVRAAISPSGRESLVPHFGPGVAEVRGMTLNAHPDSLAVLIEEVSGRQGMIPTDAQTVRLVAPDVSQLYERRLARGRSVLFGVGVLVGAFLLVDSFADLGRVFEGDDVDPPTPPQIRYPTISPSPVFGPAGSGRDP